MRWGTDILKGRPPKGAPQKSFFVLPDETLLGPPNLMRKCRCQTGAFIVLGASPSCLERRGATDDDLARG
jgi:hypothetical protein